MSKDSADYTLKILTIGESGVGKTCILLRYTDNKFSKHHLTTIGIDFKTKLIKMNDKTIKLYVWDTAGQERFRNITQQYYNGADGIFLVFDVNDKESFTKISDWMRQILSCNKKDRIGLILLGNKIDTDTRVVSEEEGNNLANEYGIKYFETSALNKYNIDESFNALIKEILIKKGIHLEAEEKERISIHNNPGNTNQSFCLC